jgi:hypothetical protein
MLVLPQYTASQHYSDTQSNRFTTLTHSAISSSADRNQLSPTQSIHVHRHSVPKRRLLNTTRRGTIQEITRNIYKTAKAWNQEFTYTFPPLMHATFPTPLTISVPAELYSRHQLYLKHRQRLTKICEKFRSSSRNFVCLSTKWHSGLPGTNLYFIKFSHCQHAQFILHTNIKELNTVTILNSIHISTECGILICEGYTELAALVVHLCTNMAVEKQ